MIVGLFLASAAACGGAPQNAGAGAGGAGRGGGRPTPVELLTLAPVMVADSSDFVGTVKSLRTTTVQSQMEGFLTRIAVTSGARVTPGTLLFEIDSTSQAAAVASLESSRAAHEADVAYAKQQVTRVTALLAAGAASQKEVEQATTAVKTSEAQLRALEEQIRLQRNELAYYRVTASTSGVIGDVPVRIGDRVTRATPLTTIEDNNRLEVYLHVPVQDALRLSAGLPVTLMNADGTVLSNERLYYVATSVGSTQTVLAKALITSDTSRFRADQFVPVRLVWSEAEQLVVPLASVTRVGGRFFVFLAEPGDGGGLVARQRQVTLGTIAGNNYVVLDGLKAGDQLIAAGVQKISDGALVSPVAPAAGRQGGEGR